MAAGHQLLARAGLAGDQNTGVGRATLDRETARFAGGVKFRRSARTSMPCRFLRGSTIFSMELIFTFNLTEAVPEPAVTVWPRSLHYRAEKLTSPLESFFTACATTWRYFTEPSGINNRCRGPVCPVRMPDNGCRTKVGPRDGLA